MTTPSARPAGTATARFIAIALFAMAVAAPTGRAAIPPAEKILPPDTLFVVGIPDCAKMREIQTKSPFGQLWNDLAMKPFHDKFVAKFKEEFVAPLERELGVKFDDYASLLQGQFTFAVTQEGWQGKSDVVPAVLFLLDTRDKSGQLKTNLADLRKKWVDAGKSIRTEKIRDIEFSILPLSSNDVPKTLTKFFPQHQEVQELGKEAEKKSPDKPEIVIGQVESLLIMGTTTKAVEKVVLHLTSGSAPALTDEAAFEANRLAMFRDAALYGWFNAKTFFDVLVRIPPEKPNPEAPNPMPTPPMDKILTAVGLTGLKTVAFDFRSSNEGSSFDFSLGTPEASRQGIFKILAAEPKASAPPAFVPANAVKFQRWRIDGQKAWAALEKMLNDISPQALNTLNFLINNANEAAKEKDPNYDFKKNVIGNLGDDLISYQKSPRGATLGELQSPPSLVLIGSPNPDQLVTAVRGPLFLLTARAGTPDEREFLGRKIYSFQLPTPPTRGMSNAAPRKLNFAASGGYVAISTDAAILEEYLRSSEGKAKPLRETAGLTEAMQRVGGPGTGMFGYENQNETARIAFDVLKKLGSASTNADSSLNPLAGTVPFAAPEKKIKDWLDFSLLPDFNKVSQYFYFTVYGGGANAEGITFKAFAPTPPQLKK